MILFEHPSSGNCLKARVMLDQVGAAYEREQLDLFAGETRTPEHFARNPDGRLPVLQLDSGEFLAESGAILLHLAEGTAFLPTDPLARARVHAWMFFEQNQVEANIGVARFLALSGRAGYRSEVFAGRPPARPRRAWMLERALGDRDFLVDKLSTRSPVSRPTATSTADDRPACRSRSTRAVAAWVRSGGGPPRLRGEGSRLCPRTRGIVARAC